MKIAEQYAGKRAKCSACGKVLTVPAQSEIGGDGSTVIAPASSASGASASPATAPRPAKAADRKCPVCGKRVGAGIAVCVGCGYDFQSGRLPAHGGGSEASEGGDRGPWFTIFGVEFGTGKIVLLGSALALLLSIYFFILRPGQLALREFEALSTKHTPRLLYAVRLELDKISPGAMMPSELEFLDPAMYMTSVPDELDFQALVHDRNTLLPIDIIDGTYNHKTGHLKMRLPNRIGDRKLDIVVNLPPDIDPPDFDRNDPLGLEKETMVARGSMFGIPSYDPDAVNVPPPAKSSGKAVKEKVWTLAGIDAWQFSAAIEPWPAPEEGKITLTVTVGRSELKRGFNAAVSCRLGWAGEGDDDAWAPMRIVRAGTAEEDALYQAELPIDDLYDSIHFKIERQDARPMLLTDWVVVE